MSGGGAGNPVAGVPAAGVLVQGDARGWIEESLADGLGLAARFDTAALAGGRVLALAGAGAGADARVLGSRESLEEGVEGSLGGAVAELAALLAAGPGARGGRLLVVEDELSAPGDPALDGHEAQLATCGADVYHWRAVTPAPDAAALTELLGSATSGYPTNAFVVAPGPGGTAGWGPLHELAEADLDGLAARVEAVLVAAYDAEGFLWWDAGAPGA